MNYTQNNPIPLPMDGEHYTHLQSTIDTVFDWEYSLKKKNLMSLYEKGKKLNWNSNDLPWDTDVDIERQQREQTVPVSQLRKMLDVPDAISDEAFMKCIHALTIPAR